MRTTSNYHFVVTPFPAERVPQGWTRLSPHDILEADGTLEQLASPAPPAPVWALDLVHVARAAYVADKKARRTTAGDGWTREIALRVPLRDPDRWSGDALETLRLLLNTVTADHWSVETTPGRHREFAVAAHLVDDWRATEVALFSGGLDSTSYAATRAGVDAGTLLLVTFYDRPIARVQTGLFEQLRRIGIRTMRHRVVPQTVVGKRLELSARSRGFFFAAIATYIAAAHGVDRVSMPENGLVAINPPLDASRPAACSTRSMHPRTLHLTNRLIEAVGGSVKLVNPLGTMTKGEVCKVALDSGCDSGVLAGTISCGSPPVKRRPDRGYHCGCCWPCLVRRSALLFALGDDPTSYDQDPWNLSPGKEKASDFLSLSRWLSSTFDTRDLIADAPPPPGTPVRSLMPVLRRSRSELAAMFQRLVPEDNRYRRGWVARV